ncbi:MULTISPECIES: ABC transporter ATP-binding protein [unclassified Micromonospora]|uniref:ABC transporter ATP-binding protein n=1 Tax=unclassified Micromonospora TaxID=2617518 RepID=UPI00362B45A5
MNATSTTDPSGALLTVRGLGVDIAGRGPFAAVRDVDLTVDAGESLALVGESGSGKTVTASAVAGLLPPNLTATGSVTFAGEELVGMPAARRRELAGRHIGFVFQEPMSALHPILTVGQQLSEALDAHFELSRAQRRERIAELLDLVGLGDGRDIARYRVGQLSGGMRQRVMIAMAISCRPRLLIADEPTTALDVTLQKQVMGLLTSLQRQLGLALVLITHDLAVVSETCERVAVMYAGELVETGRTRTVLHGPRHDYTRALLEAIPRIGDTRRRLPTVATTARDLRDERALPADRRTPSRLVEEAPGHWVRRDGEGTDR